MTVSTHDKKSAQPTQPARLMKAAGVTFATASYRTFQPWMGLPIRTTAYGPRYRLGYDMAGTIKEFAPDRAWLKLDRDDFEPLYKAKLETEMGPFPYIALFDIARDIRLANHRRQARLVLLCFDDIETTWCHRQLLASWLFERAGIECPELTPTETR